MQESLATAPDGTRIFWESEGAGAPAVLLTDGIGCAGYIWKHLAPDLARERRVIHWTYRGHGKSERPRDRERVTLEDDVADLVAVLDAAGEERVVVAGHSMGVQIALEAHRRAPSRVAGLVLVCGSPGHPIDTFHDSPVLKLAFPYARDFVLRHPTLARMAFRTLLPTDFALEYALSFEANKALVRREDMADYLRDLSDVDPPVFVRMLASAGHHDASDHLPAVDVPTLVVAGEDDSFTPMRLSVAMHEAIPGSELLVLPGGTHVAPLEHPALLSDRVRAFLARHYGAPRSTRAAAGPRPLAAERGEGGVRGKEPTRKSPARSSTARKTPRKPASRRGR